MKRLLCAAVLALLLAGSAWAAKAPDGFRGIKWGTPLEEVSGLVPDGGISKRLKLYSRPDDELAMGDIPLETLTYDFFDGRFSGVMMVMEPEHQEGIVALLTGLYGQPKRDKEDSGVYAWDFYEGEELRLVIRAEPIILFGGRKTVYRVVYQTPEVFRYMETSQWIRDLE